MFKPDGPLKYKELISRIRVAVKLYRCFPLVVEGMHIRSTDF